MNSGKCGSETMYVLLDLKTLLVFQCSSSAYVRTSPDWSAISRGERSYKAFQECVIAVCWY